MDFKKRSIVSYYCRRMQRFAQSICDAYGNLYAIAQFNLSRACRRWACGYFGCVYMAIQRKT